jgi:hypothetical protein
LRGTETKSNVKLTKGRELRELARIWGSGKRAK